MPTTRTTDPRFCAGIPRLVVLPSRGLSRRAEVSPGGRLPRSNPARDESLGLEGTSNGFQRSSPQNNFRRIVAAPIPPNHYCFDTIGYIPAWKSQVSAPLLLALLNSKLLDWYFRLGSSNSKANEYYFNNLPFPAFNQDPERPTVLRCARMSGRAGLGGRLGTSRERRATFLSRRFLKLWPES